MGCFFVFCEGCKLGGGDVGNIDLIMKYLDDLGVLWFNLLVIWDDGDNICGNFCFVVD